MPRRLPLLLLLPLLPCLLPPALGNDDLRFAEESLLDHRPDLAEPFARRAYAATGVSQDNRFSSLDFLFRSLLDQGNPDRALAILDGRDSVIHDLPDDERPILWRAQALHAKGESEKALQTLQAALPDATTNGVLALRRAIAPLLLERGATNEALQTYADLGRESASGAAAFALERARIFNDLGQYTNVLSELDLPDDPPVPAAVLVESRPLRASALLSLEKRQEGMGLLKEIADDESKENRPYRAQACLALAQLDFRESGDSVVPYADKAAELAPNSDVELKAWRLAAGELYRAGRAPDATNYLHRVLNHPMATPPLRTEVVRECADLATAPDSESRMGTAIDLLGMALEAAGFFDESPKAMAGVYLQRGRYRLEAGDPSTASTDFIRAGDLYETAGDAALRDEAAFEAASACKAAGNFPEAIARLEPLVRTDNGLPIDAPGNFRVRAAILLAQTLETHDPARCDEAYQYVVDSFPGAVDAVRYAYLRRAATQFNRGRFEEASKRYRVAADAPAIASEPDLRCNALVNAGIAASRILDTANAIDLFRMAEEAGGTNSVQASCLRAYALYEIGDDAGATNLCASIVAEHPASPWSADAALWLGIRAYNGGQFDAATNHLDFIARNHAGHPKAPTALLLATQTLLAMDAVQAAGEKAALFIGKYPEDPQLPEVFLLQGEVYRRQYSFEEASLVYEHVAQTWPGTVFAKRAIHRRGICLFSLASQNPSRYETAMACFQSLLDDPQAPSFAESLELHYRVGLCQERLGSLKEAMDTYYQGVVLPYRARDDEHALLDDKAKDLFKDASTHAEDIARSSDFAQPGFADSLREDRAKRLPASGDSPEPQP